MDRIEQVKLVFDKHGEASHYSRKFAQDIIDSLYSTPSPVAPEPKWEETVVKLDRYGNPPFKELPYAQLCAKYPHMNPVTYDLRLHDRLCQQTELTATAYKAHYEPIVEGLEQKLEDVSSMAARLFEENTELQNKITDLEPQLAHSQPLIEQKERKKIWKAINQYIYEREDGNHYIHAYDIQDFIARLKAGEPLEGGKG